MCRAHAGVTKILDVALRAGVSTATVSRALSQPDKVTESTRLRVLAAVGELGYEPNPAARSLRTSKTSKLLVTVPDISNPFFSNVIRGVEEAARVADYAVVLGDTRNDPALENQYAGMLRRHEVDGLIFLGHRLPDELARQAAAAEGLAPIVNGCEYSPYLGVSSVHIDNEAAGADAIDHLIALGHRRFGVITGPLESPLSRDRLAGVQNRIQADEANVELRIMHGDFSVESGFDKAAALLAAGVTAIFCFSDEMAFGALRAMRRLRLACPADVSIVGFDDIRFALYTTPALTTIHQPAADIGRCAVELLIKTINGNLRALEVITLPHRLVVRESTGPAPI